MKPRTIRLLSSGVVAQIDPSEWREVSGGKDFDATRTSILRVFKHRAEERFMVYGMKAKDGTKTEAYELVAIAAAVPDAVAKVAAHCDVKGLVTKALP